MVDSGSILEMPEMQAQKSSNNFSSSTHEKLSSYLQIFRLMGLILIITLFIEFQVLKFFLKKEIF